MIGLDAADPVLVERWIDEGALPCLGALGRSGVRGRLATSARYLAGSPWPTFYTGLSPDHHGIYHDFQWRHEEMAFARPASDWLDARPFWRTLPADVRVVAYDVPMTLGCGPIGGTEIAGWASHDSLGPPSSHPSDLLDQVRAEFGEWPVSPESYGPSRIGELLELREHLLENTRRSAKLASWLLRRESWDLGVVAFSALHRGGHRLWDRTSIEGAVSRDDGAVFDRALRDLYQACDRAVGELVAAAGNATVVVFSLHGMAANSARIDLLDGMLARVLHGPRSERPKAGAVRRLGEAMPLRWRRALTAGVPEQLRNRLMTLWTTGGVDWKKTEAFTLRADLQGYIRINLRGREREGIVPDADYDGLCEKIAQGLASFRDAATGDPIVENIHRARDLYAGGARFDRLPDLIVEWKDTSAAAHEAVDSDALGRVERSTPGRIPNARSGNHRAEGFFLASGPAIREAPLKTGADILDLAPAVVRWLGLRPDAAVMPSRSAGPSRR
jgi:predicted AlkP superfamily phosphohydrolase/phosphomutase